MAKIKPFNAVRPVRDKAHLVVTRPFYTYKKNVLKAKLETNPYSFMHIINPEFDKKHRFENNTLERFTAVKEKYDAFLEQEYLKKDEQPAFYLYKQSKEEGLSFTGLIAAASVDEYLNDTIKKHEDTLTNRVEMFTNYLDVVKFNAEPVLLCYPKCDDIVESYQAIMEQRPEFEFTTTDCIKHELWLVKDQDKINDLQHLFGKVEHLYIADGHHRSSSSALHAQRLREQGAHHESTDGFMAYIIDDSQLKIWEFNRLVKNLGKHTFASFLSSLEDDFKVQQLKKGKAPEQKYDFTLYMDRKWYLLRLRDPIQEESIKSTIDAQVLTDKILEPFIGISDLKTDNRIEFMSGDLGVNGIKKAVDKGHFEAGFILYPVVFDEIRRISDAGLTMPPKSTWIEPKMRSGMTILKV